MNIKNKESIETDPIDLNKAWVLGSAHFKQKIADQLNRRIDKLSKGGDRKSDEYQKQRINRD